MSSNLGLLRSLSRCLGHPNPDANVSLIDVPTPTSVWTLLVAIIRPKLFPFKRPFSGRAKSPHSRLRVPCFYWDGRTRPDWPTLIALFTSPYPKRQSEPKQKEDWGEPSSSNSLRLGSLTQTVSSYSAIYFSLANIRCMWSAWSQLLKLNEVLNPSRDTISRHRGQKLRFPKILIVPVLSEVSVKRFRYLMLILSIIMGRSDQKETQVQEIGPGPLKVYFRKIRAPSDVKETSELKILETSTWKLRDLLSIRRRLTRNSKQVASRGDQKSNRGRSQHPKIESTDLAFNTFRWIYWKVDSTFGRTKRGDRPGIRPANQWCHSSLG